MTAEPAWAVRYPDLFIGLTDQQKWDVHNNITSHVMGGWKPDRDDIADLTALTRGQEYVRRGTERVDARFPDT